MKKTELQRIIREEISKVLKETYYNPEWKYTSVHSWLEKYAAKNKLPFKLIHKTNKNSTIGKHAKTNTYYVYDIGDKYGIVVRNEKVPGAPRLDQLYVIAGPKGSALGSLVGASTLTDGSEQELAKFLDKVLGTIKEGLDSKPIKSFKVTDLAKIFAKIGFPTTKVEVFDNVSAGPTLSIEFKNTLADENEFIDAYTDFQFDNGALGSWLPDIESAYHKGGNKWEFQMQK